MGLFSRGHPLQDQLSASPIHLGMEGNNIIIVDNSHHNFLIFLQTGMTKTTCSLWRLLTDMDIQSWRYSLHCRFSSTDYEYVKREEHHLLILSPTRTFTF
ncbi:hypothetical protein HAX54_031534 [Datura stramonium]|uniref:Uncharacterized protein n=1 Tax=Datura stramonium TaxID=4076 RepID=A0ABS8RI90_DATST|nr:hypothetical protein [Datura stramonium]